MTFQHGARLFLLYRIESCCVEPTVEPVNTGTCIYHEEGFLVVQRGDTRRGEHRAGVVLTACTSAIQCAHRHANRQYR